jgi:hypothetical protein
LETYYGGGQQERARGMLGTNSCQVPTHTDLLSTQHLATAKQLPRGTP